ncbi:MAG: leucine-rich repeat domain-containing protein [Clostridia bacterium]|nr:leucine-rich repeat domain-containing protein [Clostridia bacterium]
MKKLALIILAALLALSLIACSNSGGGNASLDEYIAPDYTCKISTGTLTFEDSVGDTAIISDYSGLYTAHKVEIPGKVSNATIDERIVIGIGDEAFLSCTSITSVVIPDTVTYIGDWAFARCTALETIVIPASVTSIGKGAFSECTNLKTIIFEEGSQLASIGDYAFNDCSAVTEIALPEGLTSIGLFAFNGCNALTAMKTPSTLKSIGDLAFYNCAGLNAEGALVLNEGLTTIGKYAFAGISKHYIVAPEGSYAAKYVDAMIDLEAEETTEAAPEDTTAAAE